MAGLGGMTFKRLFDYCRLVLAVPMYPFVIALIPIVDFYLKNFRTLLLADTIRISAAYLVLTAGLVLGARLVLGSFSRAAFALAPLCTLIFLSGGMGTPACVVLVLVSVVTGTLVLRSRGDFRRWALPLNMAALVFVALPAARVIRAEIIGNTPSPTSVFTTDVGAHRQVPADDLPDIYFIVADGLGQPDFIDRAYGVPTELITTDLERIGFQVLRSSRSSYVQTALSLAATLNLAPVQDLLSIADVHEMDRRVLLEMIADSRAVRALRRAGYSIVTIPSGYPASRISNPDLELKPRLDLTFLENYVLDNSGLGWVDRLLGGGPSDLLHSIHRGRLEFAFGAVGGVHGKIADDGPAFVFAHILAPHTPFVLDAHGKPVPVEVRFGYADGSHWQAIHGSGSEDYRKKYGEQMIHTVRELADAAKNIVSRATRPTIIIIQGDHGPGSELDWENESASNHEERFGIFNAWYMSDDFGVELADNENSINTFVHLLRSIMDAEVEFCEDRQWFARSSEPYLYYSVPGDGAH